jgi:hypothetical protein
MDLMVIKPFHAAIKYPDELEKESIIERNRY